MIPTSIPSESLESNAWSSSGDSTQGAGDDMKKMVALLRASKNRHMFDVIAEMHALRQASTEIEQVMSWSTINSSKQVTLVIFS